MNRYKFNAKDWPAAIAFIKAGKKTVETPTWALKYKDDLTVKRKQIYYQNRRVVPSEKVDEFLRKKIYDKSATVPFGRDSAHYLLQKEVVGVPRRKIMEFLRAQKSLGQVRPAVAKPKQKSGERLKQYTLETDLVFVKREDVKKMNTRIGNSLDKELSYILVTVEKTTGLTQCTFIKPPKHFGPNPDEIKLKGSKIVTPLVEKHIKFFADTLKVSPKSFKLQLDKGSEFNRKRLAKVVKEVKVVAMGSSVEKRNQTVQRNLYRILKNRQASSISAAVTKSQDMCNNTFSKIQKQTPLESSQQDLKTNLTVYNSKRKSYVQGDKRNELAVGDHVRILIKKKKDDLAYKSYKDRAYSAEIYTILSKTKKKPAKYRLSNKKYYTIDRLLKSAPRDKESEKLIAARKVEEGQDEIKHEAARGVDEKKAEKKKHVEEEAGVRRKTRGARGGSEFKDLMRKIRAKRAASSAISDEDES